MDGWIYRYILWFFKSWFFQQVHGWTRIRGPEPGQSEGKTCQALATLPDPNTSVCPIQQSTTQQNANFHPSFELLQQYEPTAGGWNRREFGSYWMLIKRRIKPKWEESARQEGEWGKVFGSVDFCCPSALSPVSGASRPWILSRLASSSHFQSGNKSGLYGPGGAHSRQCSPDGLWKAQITQRGHSSLRYFWSQHNSGGIGGLHSSMSSPPTHPLGPSASLHVWLSTGSTAIPHCSLARNLEASLSGLVYLLLLLYLFPFLSFLILSLWVFFLSLKFLQL